MKRIIFLLLIPIFVLAQGIYSPKFADPFKVPDTLFHADTITGGWMNIGTALGSVTFGIILDTDSGIDSLVAVNLSAQVGISSFQNAAGQGLDDSVCARPDSVGWMSIGTIDSVCIADSIAWLYPISTKTWWNYFDIIRFRLITAATNDTCFVIKAKLLEQ